MARVQYLRHRLEDTIVGKAVVAHYRAEIRERPGAGYLARLAIKRLHQAVRLCGSQRKAAEALGISLGKLQRELRRVA